MPQPYKRPIDISPLAVLLACATLAPSDALAQHTHDAQHDSSAFHRREQQVMPFAMNATLHIFERTKTGGVQQVVVRNKADTRSLALIRSHLQKEAVLFNEGRFDDPGELHGETMPGLATLKEAGRHGVLKVSYENLPEGGALRYTSDAPDVVMALHTWFAAQVRDHGDAAQLR